MRILVIGGTGMLGHKLIQILKNKYDVFTAIRSSLSDFEKYEFIESERIFDNLDVENFDSVEMIIKKSNFDFLINAVGIIKLLPTAKLIDETLNINSIFPQRLARITEKYNFRLINISTDCVFNGKKGNYMEEDYADAEDLYGKSKFLGEVYGKKCLTLRTSIIGRELTTEHSLIEWFLKNRGKKIKGFKNAVYSGFPTIVLSETIANIIENYPDLEGVFHVSSEPINKYDLLELVRKIYKLDVEIAPYEDFYIDRSLNSTKFRTITGINPPEREEMIKMMANDPTPYEKWRSQKF